MLGLALLGTFEATRDGTAIERAEWRTRQTALVLKRLVHDRGRVVPAAELVDAVWPDADDSAGRRSLQTAIKTVRRVLEPGLRDASSSRFVRTEPGGYRFDASGVTVDLDVFARERQIALAAERRSDVAGAIVAFAGVVATYRGDYLADEPYAEWALAARELLREQWLEAVDRLAGLYASSGRHEEAIALAERGLLAEPLHEPLYRSIMRAHVSAGRRAHALATYERCERVLRGGLGVSPDPETAALRNAAASSASMGTRPSLTTHIDIPFVGRSVEIRTLREALQGAAHQATLVAVSGTAGIGKSALVRAFENTLSAHRTVTLRAHEDVTESLAAPREAVGAWLDRGATPGQVQHLGDAAAALLGSFPRIRELWPECPERSDLPLDVALSRALRPMLGGAGGLLVFDDLHWADEATLEWLGDAIHGGVPAGTLVLATLRRGERRGDPVQAFLDDLRERALVIEIPLGPLSVDTVRELVGRALPGIAPDIADRVHAATEGAPLFVAESLRDLVNRGLIYSDTTGVFRLGLSAGDPLPLSASVRDAIAARIRRLGEDARGAVNVLSATGRPERAGLITAVLGRDEDDVLAALHELLARQLLDANDDGKGYPPPDPLFGPNSSTSGSGGRSDRTDQARWPSITSWPGKRQTPRWSRPRSPRATMRSRHICPMRRSRRSSSRAIARSRCLPARGRVWIRSASDSRTRTSRAAISRTRSPRTKRSRAPTAASRSRSRACSGSWRWRWAGTEEDRATRSSRSTRPNAASPERTT